VGGGANRWLRWVGVSGGLVSLTAITTILVVASGGRDVPFENALTAAWWGGGLTGLIIGAFSAHVTSGKAALAVATFALPVGYAVSVLMHFAGVLGEPH
jgi:hypothetical protein